MTPDNNVVLNTPRVIQFRPITTRQIPDQILTVDTPSQIARFMEPIWDPPGSCRPHVGPMLTPWTLLSGISCPQLCYAFAPTSLYWIWCHNRQCYQDTLLCYVYFGDKVTWDHTIWHGEIRSSTIKYRYRIDHKTLIEIVGSPVPIPFIQFYGLYPPIRQPNQTGAIICSNRAIGRCETEYI